MLNKLIEMAAGDERSRDLFNKMPLAKPSIDLRSN
jgi:hypothetical protein